MLDPEQLVGEKIKQYRIDDHIDRGGMADVYLAFDENLHRRVALKIMLPAYAHDKQFVERFWREARTAARLDHPNIVQVYEISQTEGQRPYIAMQYIDGGSIKDRLNALNGRPMPAEEALAIVRQVALALNVAHDANIIHRDIKPSNILLRPDGTPVLVDLGIAAVQSGPKLTQTGTLIGTPHYMSPEQVSGSGLDGRSDLYSLGVVLYEMLCGSRPFEATDSLAVLHKHVYEQPQPLPERRPGLSQAVYRLVDICLQKDPNQRYQTAAEMAAAIDKILEGEISSQSNNGGWALPPLPPTEPINYAHETPPAKARPWWLLAVLVVLLGAVGAYFAFFRDGNGSNGTTVNITFGETATSTTDAASALGAGVPTLLPSPELATPEPQTIIVEVTSTPEPVPPTEPPIQPPTEAPTEAPPTATVDAGPERLEIGRSVQNRPIEAVRFGSGEKTIIFIGGLHAGFAPATVALAQQAVSYFQRNPQEVPAGATLYIIISASPDSPNAPGELAGRLNANGVDLNRNWDCRWAQNATWRNQTVSGGLFPASEPETKAMIDFIQQTGADAVVFWEALAANGLSSAGACGDRSQVSGNLALAYGLAAGYPVADFENLTNQELNGDGTNWLDLQGIPAIAVLLPDYESVDWNSNLDGMLAVLDEYGK
ncbi:MAG: protein kinase [Ardenticatenaceae bacterium]|nr:protein kinase [Ardenticatenaceae bacterium]